MDDEPDRIGVEVDGPFLVLHCGDKSFDPIVECLRSQPGVTGDFGNDLEAIHVEKRSQVQTTTVESRRRGDRMVLVGCALVALVVIIGLVNGVRTIFEALRGYFQL